MRFPPGSPLGRCFRATLLLSLLAAGTAACSRPEPVVEIEGASVPARMKIATASVGGSYYPVGNAIAQVLSNHLAGAIATAENSSGSSQNIRMLDASQVHLALSNAAITFPAVNGVDGFEKAFPVQAVMSLQASIALVVALESSGITRIEDLRGRRVATGPAGAGWDYFIRPVFAAHGLEYSDFQQVYESQANAMEMLADGAVHGVVVGGSVPHATILAATATHALAYLELDPAAIESVSAGYPFIQPFTIPAGTYAGLGRDLAAFDSGTAQLLVRADADPDFVYLIAKTIYENRDEIAAMHHAGAEITPARAAMDLGVPYHEGSLRYFTEIGLWPPPAEASVR